MWDHNGCCLLVHGEHAQLSMSVADCWMHVCTVVVGCLCLVSLSEVLWGLWSLAVGSGRVQVVVWGNTHMWLPALAPGLRCSHV